MFLLLAFNEKYHDNMIMNNIYVKIWKEVTVVCLKCTQLWYSVTQLKFDLGTSKMSTYQSALL